MPKTNPPDTAALRLAVVRCYSPSGTPTTVTSCFNVYAILYAVAHANPADMVKVCV